MYPPEEGKRTGTENSFQLGYRPPFDWPGILRFLRLRTFAGAEGVREDAYMRTVKLNGHEGWIRVRHAPAKCALRVDISDSLESIRPALRAQLHNLFDLGARPDRIAERLGEDVLLADAVSRNPGLRVPGTFDGFELGLRAILGQQISVKAAATLTRRLVEAFGERFGEPFGKPFGELFEGASESHPELTRLAPTADRIAAADPDEVAALGIVGARARSIVNLAGEVAAGRLSLEPGAFAEEAIERLVTLPGIGPWTAQYIAMRALRWSDAFPKEDVVLRRRLGGVTPARAEALSQAWRPWRSYATLHLWRLR